MSYILDALRKSEQSRQQQKAVPNLDARHEPIADADDKPGYRSWWWAGFALILLGMVAWLLWDKWLDLQAKKPSSTQITSYTSSQGERSPVTPSSGKNINEPWSDYSANSQRVQAEPGIVSQEPIPDEPDLDANGGADGFEAMNHGAASEAPVYLPDSGVSTPATRPSPATRSALNAATDPGLLDDGSVIIKPSTRQTNRSLALANDMSNADTNVADSNVAELESVDGSDLPRFNNLPEAIQSRVPHMSITSHTYSSDPAFRSVIINGQKYREGDRVESLKLEQVTEDGAIFLIDGHRFHEQVLATWGV